MEEATKQKECMDESRDYLCSEEKTVATIHRYLYDVSEVLVSVQGRKLNKENLPLYRKHLTGRCEIQTVNVRLSTIHVFLRFMDLGEYRVKFLKVQKRAYVDKKRELTELGCKKFMRATDRDNKKQLYYLMLVLYGTGIRIGELPSVTVEAIKLGKMEIYMKGKYRITIFPRKLVGMLKEHARIQNIQSGCIFRTESGRGSDRSNICHTMRRLCEDARVEPAKVFPHNSRHLFAKCLHSVEKNLTNLADILGHSSIETARIYVTTNVSQYGEIMEKMKVGFDDKKPQNNHSAVGRLI